MKGLKQVHFMPGGVTAMNLTERGVFLIVNLLILLFLFSGLLINYLFVVGSFFFVHFGYVSCQILSVTLFVLLSVYLWWVSGTT